MIVNCQATSAKLCSSSVPWDSKKEIVGYLSSIFVDDQSTSTYNMRSIGWNRIRGVRDPRYKHQVLRLSMVISKSFLKNHQTKQISSHHNNLLLKSNQLIFQSTYKQLTLTAGSTRLANPRGSFIQIPFFPCKNHKLWLSLLQTNPYKAWIWVRLLIPPLSNAKEKP